MSVVLTTDEVTNIKRSSRWDTWLAQSEEHVTVNLGVLSLSPELDVEITKKIINKIFMKIKCVFDIQIRLA